MSACPNPNDPSWKALVAALGSEGDALAVYKMNNFEVPDVATAHKLLQNLPTQEKDEQISLSSDEFKLIRAKQQEKHLEKMMLRGTAAQKEQIQVLINMNRSYQRFLEDNIDKAARGEQPIKTVSVSNLLGSADFKGDPTKYEEFKEFGIFMHEVIELAQQDALSTGRNISQVLTRDFFDKRFETFYGDGKKKEVKDFPKDMMYNLATRIAIQVTAKADNNYMILPEITVTGMTKSGSMVIGRLDMLLIDSDGNVEIFDFKTKKVSGTTVTDPVTGDTYMNMDSVMLHLAHKNTKVDGKAGTLRLLKKQYRTAYDTWTLQLKTYENILAQHGINTTNSQIVALLYETDQDSGSYRAANLSIFSKDNYYDYARGVLVPGTNFELETKLSTSDQRIADMRRIIDEEVPYPGSAKTEQAKKKANIFDFEPSDKGMEKLMAALKNATQKELDAVITQIAELERTENKDPERRKVLADRRETLRSFNDILAMKDGSASVNFSLVLDYLQNDLIQLEEASDVAIAGIKNTTTRTDRNRHKTQIGMIYSKSRGMWSVIMAMKEIVDEGRRNPANAQKLGLDSEISKKLQSMELANARIEGNFAEIGLENLVEIAKMMGEKTFEGVKRQAEEGLIPKINALKAKLEKLKKGEFAGVMPWLKNTTLSFISKEYREKIAEKLGPNGTSLVDQVTALEVQIKKLEQFLETGVSFEDEDLKKFIEGVTDPNSDLHMASSDIFNNSALAGLGNIVSGGELIAGVSDSNMIVSAYVQMFKRAQANGQRETMRNLVTMNFDKTRDELLQSMSINELNKLVSEWRTSKYVDSETGEVKEKRVLNLTKPMSEAYEQTYREYSSNMRAMNRDVYEANRQYIAAFSLYSKAAKLFSTDPTNTKVEKDMKEKEASMKTLEKAYLDKKRDREREVDNYMTWLQKNASLPYVDSYYKLQQLLPHDIRDEMQKKYLEIQVIMHQVGARNEVLLEESDLDRVKEINVEIKKLKAEAKKRNPDYARYMQEFDKLFEFVPNEGLFKRMYDNAFNRYADDPDMWAKWLKENTISRPKTEWYDRMAELYEARAAIFGTDDRIQELMEEKRAIMRPHKDASGKFNPKFMQPEEIEELDRIEGDIQDIIAERQEDKTAPKLTTQEKQELSAINAQLEMLSTRQLSKYYTELFDDKYRMLDTSYRNMINAENDLAAARAKGDPEVVKKAQKDLRFYTVQFDMVETDFEQWYNMNHYQPYQSIAKGYDVRGNVTPKSFNEEVVVNPSVYEQYMDTELPHPKYSIKRIRESAKNPAFLKSPDGIPMPKGVTVDANGHYQIMPGFESSTNINENYKKLMADPKVFDFYNKLMDMFFNLQQKVEGTKVGYMVPGYASSLIESLAEEGIAGGLKKEWSQFVDKSIRAQGAQERVANVYGDLGGRIRMRYTEQLPENMQTQDAVGAVIKYVLEANFNIAMQDAVPMADNAITYLEMMAGRLKKEIEAGDTYVTDPVTGKPKLVDMSARQRELDKIIDQLKFERKKFAYGQEDAEDAKTRALRKRLKQIMAYTAFIRMGFDAASQMKNYISGNVQTWIAAGNFQSDHFSQGDMMWAKAKIYGYDGFLANYFKDWGKVSDISDSTSLYRLINPLQKDYTKYVSEVTGGTTRRVMGKVTSISEMGNLIQDKGDTEIGLTVMYAVMNRYKFKQIESYDASGNPVYKKDDKGNDIMVPAHEAYYRDSDGVLVRNPMIEYTDEDENRLRNIIYSEIRRAQGNYASSDSTKFEQTVLGKLMFFYRKYLAPQVLNRFGYLRPNWEAGEVALGYWRAVSMAWQYYGPANTMKALILGSKTARKFGSNMDLIDVMDKSTGQMVQRQGDLYSKKINQARRDVFMMAITTMLSMLAMSYLRGKDDDDEELSMLEGNVLRIIWGVKGETTSMFPIGGGSEEYIRNFTTLTVYTRELNAIKRFGSHGLNYIMAMMYNGGEEPDPEVDGDFAYKVWKDGFYTRKAGRFEEGDAKLVKDIEDLTGIRNFKDLFDPQDRVQQMKKNQ